MDSAYLRTRLEVVKQEMAANEVHLNKFQEEIWRLGGEQQRLMANIAYTEGMLQKGSWTYQELEGRPSFYLELMGDWENLAEFCALYAPDYHEEYILEFAEDTDRPQLGAVRIRFDDGEVRLSFDTDEAGLAFIEKWQLSVSLFNMEQSLERLKHSYESAVSIHRMLKDKLAQSAAESQ